MLSYLFLTMNQKTKYVVLSLVLALAALATISEIATAAAKGDGNTIVRESVNKKSVSEFGTSVNQHGQKH